MSIALSQTWKDKVANPTQIVVLVTISNGTFTEYYCSGASKFLVAGAEPNATYATPNVDDVTPIEIKFEPKTRKPGSSECTVTFVDDGSIRALNRDWKLKGKRIVVEFLDITDVYANRAPHFRGYIEDIIPVDDGKKQMQIVARGGLGLAMARKVNITSALQRHPLQVISTILTACGLPAELINATSLDPDASAQPHSHWLVNRRTPLNGYDLGIRQAEAAGSLIEELAFLMNGSLVEMENGEVTFVRYDYTKAVAATYDVSQIKGFKQISQTDLLANRAAFKCFWKGSGAGGGTPQAGQPQQVGPITHLVEGDYLLSIEHKDADSISAYAFPGGSNGEFAEAFESKWINGKTYLAATITSGATSFDISGGGLMCMAGTRSGSFGGLTAGRPAYFLIDNEIVKVTALVVSTTTVVISQTNEDGTTISSGGGTAISSGQTDPGADYGNALAASATLTVTRGALLTTPAAHGPSLWTGSHVYAVGDTIVPNANILNQSWVCTVGGTSSAPGSEPSWPANPVLGQTTQTDTGVTWRYNGPNTGTPVYDVTMVVEYLLALIGRCSDGVPMLEFTLPLSEHFLQAGDMLALAEEVGVRFGYDGLTSADSWEIIGKRTQPLGRDPGVKVTVALARTPPAYTQAWGNRRPIWKGIVDRFVFASQNQETVISHAPNQTGILAGAGAGLNLNVTAGQISHFGVRHDVKAVASHGLTASRDVYITFDAETGFLVKRELANGAPAPSIAPSELYVAKVVTGASISSVTDKVPRQPYNGALLIDLTITSPKVGPGAIIPGKIAAGTIVDADVSATANVNGTKLLASSVDTTQLANSAVTSGKLGPNAVTAGKILAGTIVNADVNAAAALDGAKMSSTFNLPGTLKSHGTVMAPAAMTNNPLGYVFDQATTNYILNPSFEVDTSNWATYQSSGSAPTFTRDTTAGKQWIGSASGKIATVAAATDQGIVSSNIAAVAGQNWGFSAYLATSTTNAVRIRIEFLNAALASLGTTTSGLTVLSDDGLIHGGNSGFARLSVIVLAAPANTAWVRFYILNDGTATAYNIWADGLQAELLTGAQKPTSYCDGSLGPGYAWTGTANASSSTRDAGFHVVQGQITTGRPVVVTSDGVLRLSGLEVENVGNVDDQALLGMSVTATGGAILQMLGSATSQDMLLKPKGGGRLKIGSGALFSAHITADYTKTAAHTVQFNSVASPGYNYGGRYNTGTFLFTAPEDGIYLFGFNLRQAGNATEQYETYLYVNGSQVLNLTRVANNAGAANHNGCTTYELIAGDTVGIRHVPSAATNLTYLGVSGITTYGRFWGARIG